jgi:hypothetical protein
MALFGAMFSYRLQALTFIKLRTDWELRLPASSAIEGKKSCPKA